MLDRPLLIASHLDAAGRRASFPRGWSLFAWEFIPQSWVTALFGEYFFFQLLWRNTTRPLYTSQRLYLFSCWYAICVRLRHSCGSRGLMSVPIGKGGRISSGSAFSKVQMSHRSGSGDFGIVKTDEAALQHNEDPPASASSYKRCAKQTKQTTHRSSSLA